MKIENDTWNFTRMFETRRDLKKINHSGRIIVSGMGGSGISGAIASSLFDSPQAPSIDPKNNNHPIIAWKNYNLPNWANSKDYVICISYSGNTAETLSAANQAIKLGCKLEVITTGGELEKLALQNNCPVTKVETGHQPRAALPLLLVPLLYKLGISHLDEQIKIIRKLSVRKEKAREIAAQIKGNIPCIYANDIMEPVAYRWRCQIEENAKQLAFHHEIPEMNHNEIVGWDNNPGKIMVVLVRDNKESNAIKKRFETTKKIAWESKGIKVVETYAEGEYPLVRMISMILLGDIISIELAKLNNVDPTPVEVIENLKNELGGM